MKRILSLLAALFTIVILKANPIMLPSVDLSELYFEEPGKWVIELQYADANQNLISIDSIWIQTSAGISAVKRFTITGKTGLIIVRNDSLSSSLKIDPANDFIKIYYTFNGQVSRIENKPVIYGKLLNSTLDSPKEGQSIAGSPVSYYHDFRFSLDKSPTIGAINDTIGMCGTLKGHVYNQKNQLVLNTAITFFNNAENFNFHPESDGTYSNRVYSKRNIINKLSYVTQTVPAYYLTVNISPIDISMQPDSVITMDIHILDPLTANVHEIESGTENLIKLFPNPVKGFLSYEIGIPVASTNCYLELATMNGQKLESFAVTDNRGTIALPSSIRNGAYLINLYAGNKKYTTSKVIISK